MNMRIHLDLLPNQEPTVYVEKLMTGATLKIYKKSNFDWNQLKLDIQHKNMYMHQKKF